MSPAPALPAAAARLDLRDAQGRVRAQLLMQSITVGGPRMTDGTLPVASPAATAERTALTPGIAVRQLRGYLVVP